MMNAMMSSERLRIGLSLLWLIREKNSPMAVNSPNDRVSVHKDMAWERE